jgi:ribosome-binding factor A
MKQRTERLGAEILAALGEIIARGGVNDPRVRDAGLLTVTRVRVTGDLREARVGFTVHGADEARLKETRNGLTSARSFLQQTLARRLRARKTPMLSFEIDHGHDHAVQVDTLLREAGFGAAAATAATDSAESESTEDDDDTTAADEPNAGAAAASDDPPAK